MSDWFKILDHTKVPLQTTLAVAVACGVLLALERSGWLPVIFEWQHGALLAIFVLSAALTFTSCMAFILTPYSERRKRELLAERRAARRQQVEQQEQKKRAEYDGTVIKRLETLSFEELEFVLECLRRDSPTGFEPHTPAMAMLFGKRLIWAPDGSHSENHFPFSFHDFVWSEIVSKRSYFEDRYERLAAVAERSHR